MTLIERLRQVCGDTTRYYVNPDGPEAADEIERLREALNGLLDEAEDVFVCMADATGVDRHNYPESFLKARAALKGDE